MLDTPVKECPLKHKVPNLTNRKIETLLFFSTLPQSGEFKRSKGLTESLNQPFRYILSELESLCGDYTGEGEVAVNTEARLGAFHTPPGTELPFTSLSKGKCSAGISYHTFVVVVG